jgi:hypothetical protein
LMPVAAVALLGSWARLGGLGIVVLGGICRL